MPLTRDYKQGLMEMLAARPGFAVALLREGIEALLNGELELGKEVLRNYINATIGFEEFARTVKIPPKSLMRMLGPSGNPQASNLIAIIGALRRDAGIELHVAVSRGNAKRPKRAKGTQRGTVTTYPSGGESVHGSFQEAQRRFRR